MFKKYQFFYVNVETTGKDGWLDLYFGKDFLTQVRNVKVADRIRRFKRVVKEMPEGTIIKNLPDVAPQARMSKVIRFGK